MHKENLYYAVAEAEIAFALQFRIYADIVIGNQQEEAVAKTKTQHRMRTRLKNSCCIGLPVKGRAVKRRKTRKVRRSRVDPVTRQIVSWSTFLQQAI